MVLNRTFETEAERQYKAPRIAGYCHLPSGQEATTTGAVHALDDRASDASRRILCGLRRASTRR
jgi:TPP-dependent pyruvate/acetoin dehydrogenase alpha subunit